jgi:hypothetical protein
MVKVVCQCDTVTLRNLENFVLAIAVKSSPLDSRRNRSTNAHTPIECMGILSMAYNELTSFVVAGKGDDE